MLPCIKDKSINIKQRAKTSANVVNSNGVFKTTRVITKAELMITHRVNFKKKMQLESNMTLTIAVISNIVIAVI